MQEILKIGVAIKPQGVRGEIKVKPLTDNPDRFKKLKTVLIDGSVVRVLGARVCGNDVFISLDGAFDRTAAESFRGKFLCVERENAVPLEKDRYFVADLIGATVIKENGERIGVITEITEGRTDVIWLKTDEGKIASFPFLKRTLVDVDVKKGVITVKEKEFSEVVCYAD